MASMQHLDIILALMTLVAGLYTLAQKWRISYPILLVLGGFLVGLLPGLKTFQLNPHLIFLLFLPPLLFDAAWHTSWSDFRKHSGSIGRLAIGLVLFTTVGVAVCAHYLIPGMTWPLAFLLGAIVSPPDAVATMSALQGLRLPKRLTIILEGESLVNDASALIAYRYALLAVLGGNFVLWEASLSFLMVALVGILIGLMVGMAFEMAQKYILGNPTVETSVTLLLPFISYLIAENMEVSGILSVVATGLYISWHSHRIFSFRTRMQASNFWDTIAFMLNGMVFMLIGLQLPSVIDNIDKLNRHTLTSLMGYAVLIGLVTIVIRFVWIFPTVYLADWLSRFKGEILRDTMTDPKHLTILSWSGMRGVVSLATAMALPYTLPSGAAFPERNTIIFITFTVILMTLVLQGLSLPWLIQKLGVDEPESKSTIEERRLRLALTRSSLIYIREEMAKSTNPEVVEEIAHRMERQTHYLSHALNEATHDEHGIAQLYTYLQAEKEVIEHQRQLMVDLHRRGTLFGGDTIRKVEQDIDAWSLSLANRLKAFRKL
jgi:CPA1 family monovalent cation:H+ antiporter